MISQPGARSVRIEGVVKEADGGGTIARGYRFGDFRFDPEEGGLYRGEKPLDLQNLPRRLLAALLERPGVTVPRDVLYERLWPNTFVVDAVIDPPHSVVIGFDGNGQRLIHIGQPPFQRPVN